MPLLNLPPEVSDPGSLINFPTSRPSTTGARMAWDQFRMWYGNNYREAVFSADSVIFDTTPFASW